MHPGIFETKLKIIPNTWKSNKTAVQFCLGSSCVFQLKAIDVMLKEELNERFDLLKRHGV